MKRLSYHLLVLAMLLPLGSLVGLAAAPSAAAAVTTPNYPSSASSYRPTNSNDKAIGFRKLSADSNYSGTLTVLAPAGCSQEEKNAFAEITSSTKNTSEMSRWPDGIKINCITSEPSNAYDVDIVINMLGKDDYVAAHGSDTTGWTTYRKANSDYCAHYNVAYPCGAHRNFIDVKDSSYNGPNYNDTHRTALILHEMGHTLGLGHTCNDSIMETQNVCTNNWDWTMRPHGLTAGDRRAINKIYGSSGGSLPAGTVEAENAYTSSTGGTPHNSLYKPASNHHHEVLWQNINGSTITFQVSVPSAGDYDISTISRKTEFRGKFQLSSGGTNIGSPRDLYSATRIYAATINWGTAHFSSSGTKSLTFTATGTSSPQTTCTGDSSGKCYEFDADTITLTP